MLDILKYITSDIWVFMGSTLFMVLFLTSIGWALNAVVLGFKGVRPESLIDMTKAK
jgi:hypothetical protein